MELKGGSNGTAEAVTPAYMGEDNGPGKRTGIQAFLDNDVASIMAVPGVTDPNVQLTPVAHCENLASRFAVLDMPAELSKTDEIITARNVIDSTYAAMYHPWLTVPFNKGEQDILNLKGVNLIRSKERLYEGSAFLAYYTHWSNDEIMRLPHIDRRKWCGEISKINSKINAASGNPERKNVFDVSN